MSTRDDRARGPSAELRARVLAEAARTPAPTRDEHRRGEFLTAAAAALAAAALFFGMGGFARGARPTALVAFTSGLGLVTALVLTRTSSHAPRSMLGPPRHVLLLGAVVGAPVLAALAVVAAAIWPDPTPEVPAKTHLACGLITILQGALPLLALVLPRRSSDPVHPGITGAALGMTAGAWAAAMAYLRCPHAGPIHGVAAHALPAIVFTLAGAGLGHVLLKVRASR